MIVETTLEVLTPNSDHVLRRTGPSSYVGDPISNPAVETGQEVLANTAWNRQTGFRLRGTRILEFNCPIRHGA
jgi:hypothetical protein